MAFLPIRMWHLAWAGITVGVVLLYWNECAPLLPYFTATHASTWLWSGCQLTGCHKLWHVSFIYQFMLALQSELAFLIFPYHRSQNIQGNTFNKGHRSPVRVAGPMGRPAYPCAEVPVTTSGVIAGWRGQASSLALCVAPIYWTLACKFTWELSRHWFFYVLVRCQLMAWS